jgi:hypothetical protein
MRITSIVLNWNRAALLQQTLESYLATIDGPFELIVIDNASRDHSREVIESCRCKFRSLKTIFLKENLGGEAINLALGRANGDLIHIAENDQLFLDGWSQHVRDSFSAFAGLGQLSLNGVVPADDEVLELEPGQLRFSKGKTIYKTHSNIGTSCLIPARVFRSAGVRLHNLAGNGKGGIKLPDDARLSADIKNLDLWCAWSDRYYVRDLGYEPEKFSRDPRGIFVGRVQHPAVLRAQGEARPNPGRLRTKSSPGRRAAILVLGVHRSGTSCLAHLLSVLGAKLPAEVVPPSPSNPFGHWEPVRLLETNEEILSAIGRVWYDSRPIPTGWFHSKAASLFRERLRALITSEYGDAPLILIKEPRICRLAPLYLDVLDTLGIKPLVIFPVRHPGEVIRSIQERDHVNPLTIELLWLRNLLEAEAATRRCVRVWTSFDQLLDQPETTARAITARLGIIWPNNQENTAIDMVDILRPRYRHHRIADDPAPFPLGFLTRRAWQATQYALNGDENGARTMFDEIRAALAELDHFSRAGRGLSDKLHVELSLRIKENTQLRQQVDSLRQQVDSIHASICWRLTWPIRWLHKQAIRAREVIHSAAKPHPEEGTIRRLHRFLGLGLALGALKTKAWVARQFLGPGDSKKHRSAGGR